ncbi:MAG: PEP-CTERM sorting domain-containing protein, partial [Acidobacteriota bacterium]|nr:PEP-CTERM sorting domain-containing protein [Acidobacteriota bacterium]
SGTNPLPPFQTPVLTYTLPFAGVAGNVLLFEPETGIPGDVLQYTGNGTLIFYSTAVPKSFAGRFSPSIFPFPVHNSVSLNETLLGLDNGALYTPTAGQPGFDASVPTYLLISDVSTAAVPEPTSVGLLFLGGAVLLIGKSRKKR